MNSTNPAHRSDGPLSHGRTAPLPQTSPLLLTAAEVRRELRVGKSLLADLTSTGEIPSIRIGARRLYPREQLVRWIADRAAKGGRR